MLTVFTLLLSFRCGKCNTSPLSLMPTLVHCMKLFKVRADSQGLLFGVVNKAAFL